LKEYIFKKKITIKCKINLLDDLWFKYYILIKMEFMLGKHLKNFIRNKNKPLKKDIDLRRENL